MKRYLQSSLRHYFTFSFNFSVLGEEWEGSFFLASFPTVWKPL